MTRVRLLFEHSWHTTVVRFNRKSEEYQRESAIYQIFIYQLRLEKIPQEVSAFFSVLKQTANAMAISARLLLARENPSGPVLKKLRLNIDPNTAIINAKQDKAIRTFKI